MLELPWKRRESRTSQNVPAIFSSQGKTGKNSAAAVTYTIPNKAHMDVWLGSTFFIGAWGQMISLMCHLYVTDVICITPADGGI